jgi:hypothetical protein
MVELAELLLIKVFDCIPLSWIVPTQYHRATLGVVGQSTYLLSFSP